MVEDNGGSLMLTSGPSGRIAALFSLPALRTLLAFFNALILLLLFPLRKGTLLRVPFKPPPPPPPPSSSSSSCGRRALAIRRVLDDRDSGLSQRDYFLFRTTRGDTIFTQSWIPLSLHNIRGVVLLMHGLNEHSGRYSPFAKQLNANGFKVYGMDWVEITALQVQYLYLG